MSLENSKKAIIANSIRNIVSSLDKNQQNKLMLIVPENAKNQLGF